jgi:hypothetical protein
VQGRRTRCFTGPSCELVARPFRQAVLDAFGSRRLDAIGAQEVRVYAAARAMLDGRGELAEFLMREVRQRRERAAGRSCPSGRSAEVRTGTPDVRDVAGTPRGARCPGALGSVLAAAALRSSRPEMTEPVKVGRRTAGDVGPRCDEHRASVSPRSRSTPARAVANSRISSGSSFTPAPGRSALILPARAKTRRPCGRRCRPRARAPCLSHRRTKQGGDPRRATAGRWRPPRRGDARGLDEELSLLLVAHLAEGFGELRRRELDV